MTRSAKPEWRTASGLAISSPSGERDLLRFAAVGSVDDGKSTLIGRLLIDTRNVYDDQLAAVERASRGRGDEYVDIALITDGLRAERTQGITIDVAYRYFKTARRAFVIADCPGHVQYTRNMVTGASSADLVLLLVDARKGVLEQTRRHAFIASMLGIPHVVVCVNKMDLVGYEQSVFERIRLEFTDFAARLQFADVTFLPIAALPGDGVVERSSRMPWYEGPPLLYHLENVHIASDRDLIDVRFPVQTVIRPRSGSHHDYRGYAGQVAGGVLKSGDRVVVLPSGEQTTIERIESFDGAIDEAFPPMCVTVHLATALDVSRGDMIARPANRPTVARDLEAMVCCVADADIAVGRTFVIQHTTREVRAEVTELRYRVDIESLHRVENPPALGLNDIGRVHLRLAAPLFVDAYRRNRTTGSFILIDTADNRTVAAGVVLESSSLVSEAVLADHPGVSP
jgi:bifunctional enzyme CysN/CysC